MREVKVSGTPLSRLAGVVPADRGALLQAVADEASRLLARNTVWNVNSTAHGGGVAEMLQTLVAYGRGAGIDTRWFVLSGDQQFFTVTKRLHNLLHGHPGDGGDLDATDRDHYEQVLARNLAGWQDAVRPGDIVLLHDPQTAGMVDALRRRGARVVWRCHIGADLANEHTERGWAFLRAYAEAADACVFSRKEYVPDWLPVPRAWVIHPSLDPFSGKNVHMTPASVRAVLHRAGLVERVTEDGGLGYTRRYGSPGTVRAHRGLLLDEERPLPSDARVLLQVSRWDRLKDMAGVLRGFTGHLGLFHDDIHLVLAGPEVTTVSDDPEGGQTLRECQLLRAALPPLKRSRVHLCCLPMDDIDENAHLVNALQRHATLVVQKSVAEGFGLTVTEPMWKYRAVVASAVGGITDQIEDDVSGVLLDDPSDLDRFAHLAADLLADPQRRARIGAAAHQRVLTAFLPDRHLTQYGELFQALVKS